MGLGSTIHLGLSDASSSIYEPSYRNGSTSQRSSTMTSKTSISKLIRSASTTSKSRESVSSTLRPPTVVTRTSRSSTLRASTITSATSMSSIIGQSASTASALDLQKLAPAISSTNLLRRSTSKHSYFSTTASRFLWGRPPPAHSTLIPAQIATLTQTLSLPGDTPMLSSIIGALEVPISRSQFSHAPSCFCDAHFWFEQKYIHELTEVIAHEIGPQLDKLRLAPRDLLSKKTKRLLSILQPYKDIFASTTDTSSIISAQPTCPACTLSYFFNNPHAVKALRICCQGRKHRNKPWPTSMAWLDPCPGKGIDWEAKWKTEGKIIGHDRNRVQRWRRENRTDEESAPEVSPQQIMGHQAGEGCDFCDALRREKEDDEELDAVIAEEEEERRAGEETESVYTARTLDTCNDANEEDSESLYPSSSSSSTTYRAIQENRIIKTYLSPSSSTSTLVPSIYTPSNPHHLPLKNDTLLNQHQAKRASDWARSYENLVGRQPTLVDSVDSLYIPTERHVRENQDRSFGQEQAKRASDWARSYKDLVGRQPALQTTLLFQRFADGDVGAVGGVDLEWL